MTAPMLEVKDVVVEFGKSRSVADMLTGRKARAVRAVDGVSLVIRRGETLGLVGESGSGKSTVGRAILGLNQPTRGEIRFDGSDAAIRKDLRRRMQMVFQDPYSSLNPRFRIGDAIAEALRFHAIVPPEQTDAEMRRLLSLVGLPQSAAERRPRQLSGGQRQRAGLARALAVRPEFLVLDEPVAALDVSIQAQILNLLSELQVELKLTMLFIAHELGVVRHMAKHVAVMYLGKVMETGPVADVFDAPAHPYTRTLMQAMPRVNPVKRDRPPVAQGDIPSPLDMPSGCRFRTRCPLAQAICETEPPMADVGGDQTAYCHFAERTRDATASGA
ncbi:ABC transporter ATP-binding protein [Pikeienuella piscinae]|uniref:ABC transporter ATP-binding protein n=1 Tax=Pikeienuella piscinae TaxID=2748098 RepID=A0A7L5BWG3_9RHOB|nr:ABC transporter ATP-binding protein [Pikeienuella piscinae]QIE56750.1 ABC transporter ATP-binding protein [Pikeienuella piscinae]